MRRAGRCELRENPNPNPNPTQSQSLLRPVLPPSWHIFFLLLCARAEFFLVFNYDNDRAQNRSALMAVRAHPDLGSSTDFSGLSGPVPGSYVKQYTNERKKGCVASKVLAGKSKEKIGIGRQVYVRTYVSHGYPEKKKEIQGAGAGAGAEKNHCSLPGFDNLPTANSN